MRGARVGSAEESSKRCLPWRCRCGTMASASTELIRTAFPITLENGISVLWKYFLSHSAYEVCCVQIHPIKILLGCETSSGGKGTRLSGVTANGQEAPGDTCLGHSHPVNFLVLQFNTDCYQTATSQGFSCFSQLNAANFICFPFNGNFR